MLRPSTQRSCSGVALRPAHALFAAGWAWSHPAARLLRRGAVLAAALLALFLLWPSTPAHAQTCTVTVTDTVDSGAGSLRDAIAGSRAGDTICFDTTGTFSVPQTRLLGNSPVLLGNLPMLLGNSPVLLGNSPVLLGNSPVLLGDSPVLLGDSPMLLGNSPVLLGDWPVLLGDSLVLLGNLPVLLGNLPVLLGNLSVLLGNLSVLPGNSPVLLGDLSVLLSSSPVRPGNLSQCTETFSP